MIGSLDELIEILGCDSLNFLEIIEKDHMEEIERVKIKKHCY